MKFCMAVFVASGASSWGQWPGRQRSGNEIVWERERERGRKMAAWLLGWKYVWYSIAHAFNTVQYSAVRYNTMCVHITIFVRTYVSIYLCISLYIYVCMNECMSVCMYVCLYVLVYMSLPLYLFILSSPASTLTLVADGYSFWIMSAA